MTDKPIAELSITRTQPHNDRYELKVDGVQVWITRAFATVVGRDGARSRMAAWLARNPHEVRMIGVAPPVEASATDEQEIQFWRQYEDRLGGRNWQRVEAALGKATPRPTTIAGWSKLFEAVDAALRRQAVA